MRAARLAALGAAVAMALSACGSSGLTDTQLRTRATRICAQASRRTARIPTPAEPTQGAVFISRGIAVLGPELTALQRLRPPSDMSGDYRDAMDATNAELRALHSTLTGLKAGNDPVVAIKTLQELLEPVEAKASLAWSTLELPACQGD